MRSYTITLTVDRMKVEHVGRALRLLEAAITELEKEGLDIGSMFSVERDKDGVELWPEFVDSDGNIIDVQPWEEDGPPPGGPREER